MSLDARERTEPIAPHVAQSSSIPASALHAVHFYEDEAGRLGLVRNYVEEGLSSGQRVIAVTRGGVTAALRSSFPDAVRSGRLVLLDSCAVLGEIDHDGSPDRARLEGTLGSLLLSAPTGPLSVRPRLYGDVVDVLCESGNPAGALRLEQMWNEFVATRPVDLLCAYRLDRFPTAADSGSFEQLCRMHDRVIPTERYRASNGEVDRLRDIALLQQRSAALDHEIERRRVSDQLIEEAQAARDDFVVVAGHELRTPLTVIQLQVQHLVRSTEPDVPQRLQRALALTARGVDRLAMVVEQVLEVSRIDAGRMQLQVGPVDLAVVVRQAVARVPAETAGDAPIVVSAEEGLLGRWDFARIDRVVTTLLRNAVKFGGPQPVEVAATRAGSMARLTVRDHGVGIDPVDQTRIFGRYARGDDAVGLGGLGLGLWIARQVVAAHGGTIDVVSARGEGATFAVELPLVSGAP